MERDDVVALCDRYLAAVSAGDVAAVLACFAVDARQEEPVGSEPNVGHAAIGAFFERSTRTRLLVERLGPVTVQGDRAAFQALVTLEAVDGRPSWQMVTTDVVTVAEGRFTEMLAFPDVAARPGDSPARARETGA